MGCGASEASAPWSSLGIVLLLTTPPLGFHSAVAVVLPVLFLAVMVETRFSAAVPPLKEEESETQLTARVLAFLFAVDALAVGSLVRSMRSRTVLVPGSTGPWRWLDWSYSGWCSCGL